MMHQHVALRRKGPTWDRKKFALNVLPSDSTVGNIWTLTY